MMTAKEALDDVFTRITRPQLARKLGITRVAVWKWTEIPLKRVPEVSRITGLPPWKIRPDCFPSFADPPFACPPD